MRGGALDSRKSRQCEPGPSPHARGSHRRRQPNVLFPGSIPACAGEPISRLPLMPWLGVHPRMRGGAPIPEPHFPADQGPSPHARGSLGSVSSVKVAVRSIPACAGEPISRAEVSLFPRVHPRMRGGAAISITTHRLAGGPSPHARGSRVTHVQPLLLERSIPACAGEPLREPCAGEYRQVHPRMRGGAPASVPPVNGRKGPSPHARGSHSPPLIKSIDERSIPACAGEPSVQLTAPYMCRVHPRMRGGAARAAFVDHLASGPSPHARGSPSRLIQAVRLMRSIPACAGEPYCLLRHSRSSKVHPRMRGGAQYLPPTGM